MKLCIPIEVKSEGGLYTFIGNFTSWMARSGVSYTANTEDVYDLLFVNSWVVPPATVRRLKQARPDLRVVQRVDGAAVDYGGNPQSDRVQARVNLLADVTIFQSEYSRRVTREDRRVIVNDGPVIYNPVDVERFSPAGSRIALPEGKPLVACASFSVNERKGLARIDELTARHPELVFVLCGRFDVVQDRPNVVRLGHLDRAHMADAMRSCDVFLTLSENESCPNVVLEALASGLPVLYHDSGGTPEVVGTCGLAVEPGRFGEQVKRLMAGRAQMSPAARAQAVERFSPDVIFPKYLEAIAAGVRHPLPSTLDVLRRAGEGYPVLPRLRTPGELAGALRRRGPAIMRRLAGRGPATGVARVGWVTYDSFPLRKRRFRDLDPFTGMRVGNVAEWMNAQRPELVNEIYDPSERYDVVVFQKMMDGRCQDEAARIRAAGGKWVFDANVNYYEIWGDYFVPGTRPTDAQQRDAIAMTTAADWVVADSTYLEGIIRAMNPHVTWIPDNVDMGLYGGRLVPPASGPIRLVWSGVGKKAAHLLLLTDVLKALRDTELVLVVDTEPEGLPQLQQVVRCRIVKFTERAYARTLAESDIMISPKRLINAYEMAHTEYKISLGMAMGLPVVASPQRSYVEAIGHYGGGIIASSTAEWIDALQRLAADPSLRADLGARARQTVDEYYATPVVAAQYLSLLGTLAGMPAAMDAGRS